MKGFWDIEKEKSGYFTLRLAEDYLTTISEKSLRDLQELIGETLDREMPPIAKPSNDQKPSERIREIYAGLYYINHNEKMPKFSEIGAGWLMKAVGDYLDELRNQGKI